MKYLDCYIRVSTKEQAEDGDSLNSQIKVGKSVAEQLNLKFRLRNEGARSSTIHYREVFEELKDDIKQGKVTHIWCLDRSRMFRDMIDSMMFRKEYLERYQVRLFESQFAREVQFRDENEMLTYDILSRLQQYENNLRSERSQRGKLDKVKDAVANNKSVYLGGTATFGYVNENKEWVINKEEAKWVKQIFQMYEDGKSTKDIKNHLDNNGVATRRTKSGLWNMVTIQKMLRNKSYTGIHTVKLKNSDRPYSFKVPKIISVSQYNKVQKLLDANQKNKDNNKKHNALLDGLLVCECGNKMGSKHQKYVKKCGTSVDQKKYFCRENEYAWRRTEESDCNNSKALDMRATDSFIVDTVKKIVKDSNLLKEQTKKAVLKGKEKVEEDYVKERTRIEEKIQRIQKSIDNIENQIVDLEVERGLGKKEERIVVKVIQRYENELENQNQEYRKCEKELDSLDDNLIWVDWVKKFSDELDVKTRKEEDKKQFLEGLIERIVVSAEFNLNRDEKKVQHGHSFKIMFNMGIVGDRLIFNDESNKKLGYEIIDGKKNLKTGMVYDVTARAGRKRVKKKARKTQ